MVLKIILIIIILLGIYTVLGIIGAITGDNQYERDQETRRQIESMKANSEQIKQFLDMINKK